MERGPDTHAAEKVEPVHAEAPAPFIRGPEPVPQNLSPPPAADAATGIVDGPADAVRVQLDTEVRVQSLAMDEQHIYISRTAIPGGDRGQIARVPITGGKLEIVVDDLGRPDEIAVAGDEVFWIDRPSRDEDPKTGVRAVAKAGGEVREIAVDPRIEHGLTVADDTVYWVLRVEEQGRVGGFAGAARAGGGKIHDWFRDKGPVFHLRAADGHVVFMAHAGDAPDVIYAVAGDGSDLRELHRAPRGIVALHVADGHVYWAQAQFDSLSTHVMRIPLAGGEAQTLWRLDGKLLDQVATDAVHVWTSTSAVEDLGEVFRLPKSGGDATRVAESRHVWRLLSVAGVVYWWDTHYTDQKKMHRVRRAG